MRVGDSFYAIERRDEYLDRKKDDPKLPYSVVARLVVVRLDEGSCTAVVVQASRVIDVGLHVTQTLE